MSEIPENNKCEICNQRASTGIVDENNPDKTRYTCQDHYLKLYEKIALDYKK